MGKTAQFWDNSTTFRISNIHLLFKIVNVTWDLFSWVSEKNDACKFQHMLLCNIVRKQIGTYLLHKILRSTRIEIIWTLRFTLTLEFGVHQLYLVLISFGALRLENHSSHDLTVEIAQFLCSIMEHLSYNIYYSKVE